MTPRSRWLLLVSILALAGLLRGWGLGWGLRHTPHWDERVFVENARAMVEERSLDHRYYEYPGLFFYLLAPLLALLPREALGGPAAYLVARGLIAAFGVASVGLTYALGARLSGVRAGLAAALFLAVSPLEVVTAHQVRPDVALESFALLALLALSRLDAQRGGDLRAGAAIGAAIAVKFTGLLLAPSYLVARALAPGPRLSRALLAGAVALAVALAFTPYALLNADAYLDGVGVQMGAHYKGRSHSPHYLAQLGFYLNVVPWAFGPIGALLILGGLLTLGRDWRRWAPLVTHPVLTLLVMSSAELKYERHLVPVSGALAILAGRALAAVASRRPRAAAAILLASALPLAASVAYVRGVARPSTKDRALDWVLANLPAGSRVATGVPELGLDRSRFEVLTLRRSPTLDALVAREADAVVALPETSRGWSGLATVFVADPTDPPEGARLVVQRPVPARATRPLALAVSALAASENGEALAAVLDGRLDSAWQTAGPQRPQQWLEARFAEPVRVARVELLLPGGGALYAENLHLLLSQDGASWSRVPLALGRPEPERQLREPRSQLLLLEPRPARALRVVQMGRRRRPWAVAELRIEAAP